MYTEEDLASAVKAGALTEETAAAFRAHVAQLKNESAVDEEHFHLVTGFNDIFVVIACALLLVSVGWIGAAVAPWLGALAASIAAWALAEFFVRKRRMALPAIVLRLAFVGGVFGAGALLLGGVSMSFAITGLTIGSALLLLSAFWHASRAFVLRRLPPAAQERLAPSR
jgi:hypothetical protein